MHVIAVDRPGVNDHFVRPGCLANQLAAPLPHVAAENGEPIFRNPYNVVLTVPDRMAAAFVALHDPVYTGPAGVPCRLKAWGFLIPYRGLSDVRSQARRARLFLSTRTGVKLDYKMDRADERAGPEDVGEQALIRGL